MKKRLFLIFALLAFQPGYGQEFILVFLNKKTDKEALSEEKVKEIMDGHLANINRLAKEGKLIAAGPFDGGGGIFIFKSGSTDQVRTWLATDPGVQAKRWDIELFPYLPRQGSVCSVGEQYEMTNYVFIRYSVNATKDTMGSLPESIASHDDYVKQFRKGANVIAEGSLGDQEGSILVLSQELPEDKFANDPAIRNGAMTAQKKKLYIAKGSFCETKP